MVLLTVGLEGFWAGGKNESWNSIEFFFFLIVVNCNINPLNTHQILLDS